MAVCTINIYMLIHVNWGPHHTHYLPSHYALICHPSFLPTVGQEKDD